MGQLTFNRKPDIYIILHFYSSKINCDNILFDGQGFQVELFAAHLQLVKKNPGKLYKKPNSQSVHILMDFYPLNSFEVFDLGHRVTLDSSARFLSTNGL